MAVVEAVTSLMAEDEGVVIHPTTAAGLIKRITTEDETGEIFVVITVTKSATSRPSVEPQRKPMQKPTW